MLQIHKTKYNREIASSQAVLIEYGNRSDLHDLTSLWSAIDRLGLLVCSALVLLISAMLFPNFPEVTHAEEGTIDASISVNPVLSIALQDSVSFNILPVAGGTFRSSTATLSVSTNNETGYSLYLSSGNGENTLKSINPSITSTISAVSGTVTSSNFSNNTWGYNLSKSAVTSSTTYRAIPTSTSTPQATTDLPTDSDTYNLTFGAKVNTSLPSGTYSNSVTASVVANPKWVVFNGITTMQEMISEICANAAENATAELTDTRDSNTYTVTKINGNCWMTQNLRLSGGRTLTSSDSNVTSSYTLPSSSLTSGSSYTEARLDISATAEYGGYYNYCAASAGTVCDSSTQQDATQDICPKGWKLPSLTEMQTVTSYTSAFSPVYSGYYGNGSLYDVGSSGNWWSSTAEGSMYQYLLSYNSGGLGTAFGDKDFGSSIRCIQSS